MAAQFSLFSVILAAFVGKQQQIDLLNTGFVTYFMNVFVFFGLVCDNLCFFFYS